MEVLNLSCEAMSSTPYSVLISGAGIAGASLAFWLQRHGFSVTVVERAATIRSGGQAVDIRGVAREVVEWMGVLPAVRQANVDERRFAIVDDRGKHVVEMPSELFGGEGIVAEIEILRGTLACILYEATANRVEYVFDDSIDSLVQHDDRVDVTFVRGRSQCFDVVIGADGVHSRVRALAFGRETTFVHSLGAYSAFFTSPQHVDTDRWFVMYNTSRGRAVGVRPSGPDSTQVMFSFRSPPLSYDRQAVAQQKQLVSAIYSDLHWEIPRLLRAMWDAPDFYLDLIGHVRMPRWAHGRVALLGDAAYAPSQLTGLGTSLAIVAAYVLAGELASAAGDHRAAFTRYQTELSAYVKQCQQLPPFAVGGFLPRNAAALWLRNQSMRMITRWPWRHLASGMFQHADRITLKDYAASPATARTALAA